MNRSLHVSISRLGIACALLLSITATAQTAADNTIKLSQADQQRLGIRFAEVKESSSADGFQVPALVIHSPDNRSRLTTYFSGTVKQWHLSGGQQAQAGQPVVTLSSPELMQLQEQWLAARHQLSNSNSELDRDKQLFADGVISEQRLQKTRRSQQQAAFALRARQQQLLQAGLTSDDLSALVAGQLLPGEYVMRAPRSGLLSRRNFSAGDIVAANQALASVTDNNALWLRASLPAALAETLQPGDTLQLAGSDMRLTLASKNRDVSPSTQTVDILAAFNQPGPYLPGQQVTLVVSGPTGFRVPASAVTHTGSETFVYVRGDNHIEIRSLPVTPLGRDYLVTQGLRAGEQLVVQGGAQLKGIQLGLGGGE